MAGIRWHRFVISNPCSIVDAVSFKIIILELLNILALPQLKVGIRIVSGT